jgi:prolyl oligopeptidase
MIRSLIALTAFVVASQTLAQGAAVPPAPVAPVRTVTETFFGTEVRDPYRWMEDTKSDETQAWMKAAAAHAQATLARIPGRQAMVERILKYDGAVSARIEQVVRESHDRWFYERRGAQDNQFKLWMRQGLVGKERLLVDPEDIEKRTGKPQAVNYFSVAPGGGQLAYGLSAQGSEAAVLHVVDTKTGRPIGQPIDRAETAVVSWSPDARWMLFTRLQKLEPGMPDTEKYQKAQVLLLERGADVQHAVNIFGVGAPGVDIGPAELPFASFTHDGRWALGIAANGTQRELGFFVTPAKALLAGKPAWKRVVAAGDEVTGMAYMNDALYLLSHKNAPRSQVLRLDLRQPDIARARVLVPQSERVITGITAAADALYIEARDGNVKRLFKRAHAATATVSEVKLPLEGSFQLNGDEGGNGAADPRLPGLVLDLQGWNRARQLYLVSADGRVRNSGLQPQGPFDAPADIVATEVKVKSHDGAMVPMSIIHKQGTKLDGRNPTILYGYASYGITEEPFYSVYRLAWLDAGGVYAVANPRGSSVYGEDWYKGGFQATKPNTWKDFIACAEWLIAQKWTSPDRLGIFGGSAGGILVGRALTERPDLFAAVVPSVGALDMLRFENTANGVPNIPEFGTRTTEAGFRSLLAMSTYAHITDGTKYPAVMLTHGVNDPRVEVWESTKTAARLMAATSSGKPVLMRLDFDAGHGIGNTKSQQAQERGDIFSFFLWQMGVPGYQPTP